MVLALSAGTILLWPFRTVIRGKIQTSQIMTVISWSTYPVAYLFPMGEIGDVKDVFGCEPRQ